MKTTFNPPMQPQHRGDLVTKVVIVFAIFCCLNVLYFLSQAASPMIRGDAWYFLDSLILKWRQAGFDFLDLFIKRGISDHAQPANKLIFFLNYKFAQLDFRIEALFGFFGLITFIFICINLYFQRTVLAKRSWLSGVALISALLIITSLNATVIYTWPLVTFAFISILLAALAALMTWKFLEDTSTIMALAITAAAFLLLGDTATVITWISLAICVVLAARHSDAYFRQRARKWIVATAILVFAYFLAVNGMFLFQESSHIKSQIVPLVSWLDPFLYLEILRIVFSESLVHGLHLQRFGDLSRPISWLIACLVFGFYVRFFILLLLRNERFSIATFFTCFLLIFATISVVAIVVGRVSIFGVEYLHQPRYVFTYQLIPFALLLDASFALSTKKVKTGYLQVLSAGAVGAVFFAMHLSFIISAHKTVPYILQYYDKQAKAIGYYASNEALPAGDCTPVAVPICDMPPPKRIKLLKFLEEERLNIFNSSFQWRYRLFPFDPTLVNLKIGNWGPQSINAGVIPNKQANGSMGIWIEVSGGQGLGEAQVLFSGQPAKSTSVQTKLITAAIAPGNFSQVGKNEISIRQVSTGKVFHVGMFNVEAAK